MLSIIPHPAPFANSKISVGPVFLLTWARRAAYTDAAVKNGRRWEQKHTAPVIPDTRKMLKKHFIGDPYQKAGRETRHTL